MWLTAFLLGILCGILLGGLGVFVLLYLQQNKPKTQKKTTETPQDYEYLATLTEIKHLLSRIPQNYLDKSTYQQTQEKLSRQLQQLRQELQTSQRREFAQLPTTPTPQPSQNYSLRECIQIYNQKPTQLLECVINYAEVVELDERQASRRRAIDSTTIILDICYGGHFWVVQIDESSNYYLFPNNHQINFSQAFTAKALFNGYLEDDKSTFTVINPALVTPINDKQWQLLKKGDLQLVNHV